LGYAASFPATANGEYESATTASRTLVFIFHAPLFSLDFFGSFFAKAASAFFCPSRVGYDQARLR
jgi:hypothetical protein